MNTQSQKNGICPTRVLKNKQRAKTEQSETVVGSNTDGEIIGECLFVRRDVATCRFTRSLSTPARIRQLLWGFGRSLNAAR